VEYAHRSDNDLVELAQAGWRSAFAVLVHRHASAVHAAVAADPDPLASTVEVFTDAMRGLGVRDPNQPVLPWLLSLAGATSTPTQAPLLPEEQLDRIWRRLDERWEATLTGGEGAGLFGNTAVKAHRKRSDAVATIRAVPKVQGPRPNCRHFTAALQVWSFDRLGGREPKESSSGRRAPNNDGHQSSPRGSSTGATA
jgi:hypothetical protein